MFKRLARLIKLVIIQASKGKKETLVFIWLFQFLASVLAIALSVLFFLNIGGLSKSNFLTLYFFEIEVVSDTIRGISVFSFLILGYAVQNVNEIVTDIMVSNLAVHTEQASIGEILSLLRERKIDIVHSSPYGFSKQNLSRAIKFDARSLTIVTRSVIPSLIPVLSGLVGILILLYASPSFGLLILIFICLFILINRRIIRRGESVSANFENNNEEFTREKDAALLAIIAGNDDEFYSEDGSSESQHSSLLSEIGFSKKAQQTYDDLRYRYLMNSFTRIFVLLFSMATLIGAILLSLGISKTESGSLDTSLALSLSIIIMVFGSFRPLTAAVANTTKLGSQVERLLEFVYLLNNPEISPALDLGTISQEECRERLLEDFDVDETSKPQIILASRGLTKLMVFDICERVHLRTGIPFKSLLKNTHFEVSPTHFGQLAPDCDESYPSIYFFTLNGHDEFLRNADASQDRPDIELIVVNKRVVEKACQRYQVSKLWVLSEDDFSFVSSSQLDSHLLMTRGIMMMEEK